MLEPLRSTANLPAMAVAAVSGETLVALGATGLRKSGNTTPVTAQDRFHLGSCTKAITATLFAIAIEEGALTWDSTLADAFPALSASMHADYVAVTLEQLTAHWGGTWSSIIDDHPATWNTLVANQGPLTDQRTWFVEQVLTVAPDAAPGTVWSYSNAGYMIVGAAVEAALGDSWEDLITSRIFVPLGMSSCGFGPPGVESAVDEPWGHVDDVGGATPLFVDNPPAFGPAGTVHCNMADWGKFISQHVIGEHGESSLLPAASFSRLHTAWGSGDYAAGWILTPRSWAQGDALIHSGSNTFWYATVWIGTNADIAVFGATNVATQGAALALDDAFTQLLNDYAPPP